MKMGKRRGYEKPVRLDMPFDEALKRYVQTRPGEISLRANRISILALKTGAKEISQMQGDLKLRGGQDISGLAGEASGAGNNARHRIP